MKGADHIVKLERAILVEYSAGRKDTLSRQDVGFILSPERRMIPTRSSFEEARYPGLRRLSTYRFWEGKVSPKQYQRLNNRRDDCPLTFSDLILDREWSPSRRLFKSAGKF